MADNELIEKLLIHTPHEINTGTSQLQNIIITITATKEDTFNPGKFEVKESIFNVNPEKRLKTLSMISKDNINIRTTNIT